MKSRTAVRLLPVALAVATVTAMGAPASAEEAPPPQAEGPRSELDCTQALQALAYFNLLPEHPDIGRTLCSINSTHAQEGVNQQNANATDPTGTYVPDSGRPATQHNTGILGIPAGLMHDLTAYVSSIDPNRPYPGADNWGRN